LSHVARRTMFDRAPLECGSHATLSARWQHGCQTPKVGDSDTNGKAAKNVECH